MRLQIRHLVEMRLPVDAFRRSLLQFGHLTSCNVLDSCIMIANSCEVSPCQKPVKHIGLCAAHYMRQYRYGDARYKPIRQKKELRLRFIENLPKIDECWEWAGRKDVNGYGVLDVGGRPVVAHKIGYELIHGPVPTGLELDHLCRNPPCVNPLHLEAVTHKENISRGRSGHHMRKSCTCDLCA